MQFFLIPKYLPPLGLQSHQVKTLIAFLELTISMEILPQAAA